MQTSFFYLEKLNLFACISSSKFMDLVPLTIDLLLNYSYQYSKEKKRNKISEFSLRWTISIILLVIHSKPNYFLIKRRNFQSITLPISERRLAPSIRIRTVISRCTWRKQIYTRPSKKNNSNVSTNITRWVTLDIIRVHKNMESNFFFCLAMKRIIYLTTIISTSTILVFALYKFSFFFWDNFTNLP